MKKVILGIGNPLKNDDNIGNLIVDELKTKLKDDNLVFIKSYLAPENFIFAIKRYHPKKIFMIDAVDFKGEPGDVKVFNLSNVIKIQALSTHSLPITLYKNSFPKADIKIIGIKVKSLKFKDGLSPELKKNFQKISQKVQEIILQ